MTTSDETGVGTVNPCQSSVRPAAAESPEGAESDWCPGMLHVEDSEFRRLTGSGQARMHEANIAGFQRTRKASRK